MADESRSSAKKAPKKRSKRDLLDKFYAQFSSKDQVLVTIDPDPDAIASALAVRRLLWRKVQSTTIGMIRPIRRLNNVTMVRLLKLPLTLLNNKTDLSVYDKFVLVDAQPVHNELFQKLSYGVVIDHHPMTHPVDAPFKDVRSDYGSTSTILISYLKAAKIKPSATLATALLYGVKTDTRNFERHTLVEDIEAFRTVYPLANHSALRKIEISDLALEDLKFFQKAVEKKHVVKDRIYAHLDEVPLADILVEVAEFFLKIHDISWSIISGIFDNALIVVIRNDGYRKDAGKAVREAFGSIGCAGGHASMARAEIPLENLSLVIGKVNPSRVEKFVRKKLSPYKR